MSGAPPPVPWGSIAASVFAPTILFGMGQTALVPVIPVLARDLGADLGGAALIASMLVVGVLLGDIPSGAIVARIGERRTMIGAAGLALVGVAVAAVAPHPALLGAGVLLAGLAGAAFGLARHAYLTTAVPQPSRARALSTLGGSHRLGSVAGPFVGAGLLAATGTPHVVLWFFAGCIAAAIVVLLVAPDPDAGRTSAAPTPGEAEVAAEALGLWRTIARDRHRLLTVGTGSAVLSALRQVRQVVLPVWAVSIGLDVATTSVMVGVAGAVDFSLFFLGGWIMDRFGRLWTAIPCTLGIALGLIALAFTHDAPNREWWFAGLAMVVAVANGIGSGVLMTLGADLADRRRPAPFLGAWRFTNDLGGAAGPVAVTAVTALAGLPVALAAVGVVGIAGAVVLRVYIPRYVAPRPGDVEG